MTETSWIWDGITTGDAATNTPYDANQWATITRVQMMPDLTRQGVIGGTLNSLTVTTAHATSISVDSGAALVYGKLYYNDSPIGFNVDGALLYWLVGLALDENAKTVRAFARGYYDTETAALNSLTQVAGVKWEIPLAVVLTDDYGNVSDVVDERIFVIRPQKQRLFVNAAGGMNTTDTTDISGSSLGVPMADNHRCIVFGHVIIPHEFRRILCIKPVILATATGSIYSRCYASFNDIGNYPYNAYVADSGSAAVPVTAYESETVSPIYPLVGVGGDNTLVCITYVRDAVQLSDTINGLVYCVGWIVEYEVLMA